MKKRYYQIIEKRTNTVLEEVTLEYLLNKLIKEKYLKRLSSITVYKIDNNIKKKIDVIVVDKNMERPEGIRDSLNFLILISIIVTIYAFFSVLSYFMSK